MNRSSRTVRFFYGTRLGRALLAFVLRSHVDRVIVRFLWSRWSRPLVGWYARRHGIALSGEALRQYGSFRAFFARERTNQEIDQTPDHLISPCDGWLSAYPIEPDSSFQIKGFRYGWRICCRIMRSADGISAVTA